MGLYPITFTKPKTYFWILVLSTILCAVPVSASENYTPVFNPTGGDIVHINQSWIINTSPGTPWETFIFVGALGIILLLMSFVLEPQQCNDIVSIMAWIPLISAATMATSIDQITGAGVTSLPNAVTGERVWVLLENHTVYSYNVVAFVFFAFFIISLFNTYRIWLNNKRIQETIEGDTRDGK